MAVGTDARILVVDDDPAGCRYLVELLTGAGYGVEAESDAVRALDLVQDPRYRLVVSDVVMPEMSGTTLVAHLGRLRPDVPALLVSAFPDATTRAEARALGVPLLAKPFATETLITLVGQLLEESGERRTAP